MHTKNSVIFFPQKSFLVLIQQSSQLILFGWQKINDDTSRWNYENNYDDAKALKILVFGILLDVFFRSLYSHYYLSCAVDFFFYVLSRKIFF